MESSKRRKVDRQSDFDTPYVAAPSTSRTAAKAAALAASVRQAAVDALKISGPNAGQREGSHVALLSLATLPPASIQKYLSRYGLLEPQGSLSYHHAVFPVAPLPEILTPPLTRRNSVSAGGYGSSTGRDSSRDRRRAWALEEPRQDDLSPIVNYNHLKSNQTSAQNSPIVSPPTSANTPEYSGTSVPLNGSTSSNGASQLASNNLHKRNWWAPPKTIEFTGVTAYDDPHIVVERLAAKAKIHWDKRDSVKEGETLTNFIFALRMRDKTLRATPPG